MIIYALIDPRDSAIRYIGKTFRSAHRRLRRHLSPCFLKGNTHKERWIRCLLAIGLEPQIVTLQECTDAHMLSLAERAHIQIYRANGARLTNATDGGDGAGCPHTPESRAKIRLALTGKPKSELHRLRSAAANRGRKASDVTRAKLSEMRRGKGPPPRRGEEHCRAKLTADQVVEIRALRGIVSQRKLGQRFGVSKAAIRFAQIGKNWKHLPMVRQYPARGL